jgi:hypothetical protein
VGTKLTQDGDPRDDDGAQVADITDPLDVTAWPAESRVIVRRERPHPGAQLSFTDHDGHCFQTILTDQPETDIAYLDGGAPPRPRARRGPHPHRQRLRHGEAPLP